MTESERVEKQFLFLLLVLTLIIPAYAQSQIIEVRTDKTVYQAGDTIVISGKVTTIIEGIPINIQIFRQGNLITIGQLDVAKDGTFSKTVLAEGPLWRVSGDYNVKATYIEGIYAESEFEYNAKQSEGEFKMFEVDAGNQGTFDVEYQIVGADIVDIEVDQDILGLFITLDKARQGSLTVVLPRESIDSKKMDGSDEDYIIIVDGNETPHVESDSDSRTRTMRVNFDQGAKEIEIIGTFVVPEFGTITMLVLAITLGSSIFLVRRHII